MEYKINNEAFSTLEITLNKGEYIDSEMGSFVSSNKALTIEGTRREGIFSSLKKSILAGESFFTQRITAKSDDTNVLFSARSIGNIKAIEIQNDEELFVVDGAYLADVGNVSYTTTMQKGMKKGLFSNGGFFILKMEGRGVTFINSFGSISKLEVKDGEELTIDNGHVLAWTKNCSYELEKSSSSWVSSIKSGEMYVAKFRGNGFVYIQSHNLERQAQALQPHLQTNNANSSNIGDAIGGFFGGANN